MSVAHLSVDILSAYIDRELSDRELAGVEEHLEECGQCRHQLDSLGRVVGRLRGLERLAPPQLLEMDVQRRVALTSPRRSFLDDFDARLGRLPLQPGTLVTFALVFAFAAILFTFAKGLEDRQPDTIPVLLGSSSSGAEVEVAVEENEPLVERTVWVWDQGWVERASASAGPRAVATSVTLGSSEWEALIEREPELASFELGSSNRRTIELGDGTWMEVLLEVDALSEKEVSP